MIDGAYFTISDFAKFARTTRDALLHYDKIGLLSPDIRGPNNYRYYSSRQFFNVNVIRTLQESGMTLEEIKEIYDYRTPENMSELFSKQISQIDAKIAEWVRARKLLFSLKKTIDTALSEKENEITVKYLPSEAIIIGDLNDYSRGRTDIDALLSFYNTVKEKYEDVNQNYPVWALWSEERVKRGDWVLPDRYYYYNPEGHDKRPAALYAIGYARGWYGQSGGLFKKIVTYINKNRLEICGDAYEEYPLNEICVSETSDYLIRIMIPVREK